MLSYVADRRESLLEVEKHGITIPDRVAGWILLRRSGLTTEQKQMVQSRASDFKQTSVTEAFYFLFGQDFSGRAADNRSWRAKPHGGRWSRQRGYHVEEPYVEEPEDFDEDTYYIWR